MLKRKVVISVCGGSAAAFALVLAGSTIAASSAMDAPGDLEDVAREISIGESPYLDGTGITDVEGVVVDDDGNMTVLSGSASDEGKTFTVGSQTVTVVYGSATLGGNLRVDAQ